MYEDNITQCAVSSWIIGKQGDRERVSNKGINLIKTQYLSEMTSKTPLDYQYILYEARDN
jgi:hypothetical protein